MSEHFKVAEAKCKDGTPYPKQWYPRLHELFHALEIVRALTGKPMRLHSVYRTKEHNDKVGGAPDSCHLKGYAADFELEGMSPKELYPILDRFQRLGVLPKGGLHAYSTFVHLDIEGSRLRRW